MASSLQCNELFELHEWLHGFYCPNHRNHGRRLLVCVYIVPCYGGNTLTFRKGASQAKS